MEDTKILHDSGFWIHGMFVLGPHDTPRTANRIVQFARRGGIESIQISILTPLPGTPLMDQFRPHLVFTDYPGDWDFYDGTHCVYGHGVTSPQELQRALLKAHRKFYTWGGWSGRRFRSCMEQRLPVLDKLSQLWANARTARTTLREWARETKEYLEILRTRRAR
jgi:hypothetical protein